MEDILLPIFICVVLPVMIVWLVTRAKQNETNKKAEIMLKAIENGACITSFMGVAFLVLWVIDQYGSGLPNGFFLKEMLPVAGGRPGRRIGPGAVPAVRSRYPFLV